MSTFPDKALIKSTIRERVRGERRYNPHGTRRMEALAGVKLASFKHRFWAFAVDSLLILMLTLPFGGLLNFNAGKIITFGKENKPSQSAAAIKIAGDAEDDDKDVEANIDIGKLTEEAKRKKEAEDFLKLIFGLVYYGFFLWVFNGRTPGKKWMGVRVVSLTGERVTLWQAVERTLGYGASALEGGFGYVQFFINPNRCCVHDRIAETIVIEDPPREKKAAKQEAETVKEVARLEAEEAREVDEEVLQEAERDEAAPVPIEVQEQQKQQ